MAKLRKRKKSKRAIKAKKTMPRRRVAAKKPARKAASRRRASSGIGKRISGAMQVVANSMDETTRMRRKMKKRSPMDEG